MRKMPNALKVECIDVLADYTGVQLTVAQFDELMSENPRLNNQLIRFRSPSDTQDREYMMEALAVKLVGRPWPCYGDGKEAAERFYEDFNQAVIAGCYTRIA